MAPRKRLGEILLEQGLIDETQLRSAMGHQHNWGGKLGSTLVELGFITEEDIARVLEGQLRQHCLSQKDLKPQSEALNVMSMEEALKHVVLPLKVDGGELTLAMTNPFNLQLIDELGFKLGRRIKGVMAVESAIKKAIKRHYGNNTGRDYMVDMGQVSASDPPEIIHDAYAMYEQPVEEKEEPEKREPKKQESRKHEPRKHEPSPELISKALAYLLIEKGIVKRDELIEKMKALKEKGMG